MFLFSYYVFILIDSKTFIFSNSYYIDLQFEHQQDT